MKITINEDYFIQDEGICFTLKKYAKTFGTGKNKTDIPRISIKDCGYYVRPEDAIKRALDHIIDDGTKDFNGTFEEYYKRIKDINESTYEKFRKEIDTWLKK